MGVLGVADLRLAGVREVCSAPGHRRSAAAAARHPADLHRRAARDARAAGGDAGAHVSRVAGQADLRHSRDPSERPRPPYGSRQTTSTVSRSTSTEPRAADQGADRTSTSADPRITASSTSSARAARGGSGTRDLVIGQPGLWPLVRYELTMLLAAWVPGALGLFLRSKLYPLILGRVGSNVAFGCNVVLRHPHKIQIGDNVVVDDNCCLDAKGTTTAGSSIRRRRVSRSQHDPELQERRHRARRGREHRLQRGSVFSAANVRIGRKVLVAAYTYLVGGDPSLRSRRCPGARSGPHGTRHRGRRQRLARRARRRDRRRAHRPGRGHRRRRGRDGRRPGISHRGGCAGARHARSADVGVGRADREICAALSASSNAIRAGP